MVKKLLLIVSTILISANCLLAQTDAEIKKWTTFKKPADAPQVMILGSFHFHNPGADFAKFETADIMGEKKQKEIAETVTRLAKFKPTKIAIEWTTDRTDETNKKYTDFLAGKFSITEGDAKVISNEVYQLGFRLAKNAGHKQIYLVDFPGGMNISAVLAYAEKNDPEYAKKMQREIGEITNLMNLMQKNKSIPEILRIMNHTDTLSLAQSFYIEMAAVGAGDNYIGADVVTDWYKRNLKIFANIDKIAEPNDRILLIIGQGHKPILQQLIKESPQMKLVDVMDYL
jgi:hypothetical protein